MEDTQKQPQEFNDQWSYMELNSDFMKELRDCVGQLGHVIELEIKKTEKQLKQMEKL